MPSAPARCANSCGPATCTGTGSSVAMKSCSQSTNTAPGICPSRYSACFACGSDEEGWRPRTSSTRRCGSPRLASSHSLLTSGAGGILLLNVVDGIACPLFPACRRRRLRLLSHGDQVVARHLPDQLGMVGLHVLLDRRRRRLDGLAAPEKSALTPNHLRHDNSSFTRPKLRPAVCRVLRFSLLRTWRTRPPHESSCAAGSPSSSPAAS